MIVKFFQVPEPILERGEFDLPPGLLATDVGYFSEMVAILRGGRGVAHQLSIYPQVKI